MNFLSLFEKRETRKIEMEVSDQAAQELIPLLLEFQTMGSMGCSRSVAIEDWDGKTNFGFDGDGNSKIFELKLDGAVQKRKSESD